jgi:HAD superfamily hydrolase (TIGR01509 family)
MAVIFDLDQTLVDSSAVEPLRKARLWKDIPASLTKVSPYPGICDLVQRLQAKGVPTCIVTRSPKSYAQQISRHCGINGLEIIGYHDVAPNIKPHPAAYILAMERMKVDPDATIAIGDDANDIRAAHAANIKSAAALWGCSNSEAILAEKANYQLETVEELVSLLQRRYSL